MVDTSSLSTLPSVIKEGIDNRLKDLHTALPGIIKSFDASTQLASVQPCIKRVFKTRDAGVEFTTPADLPLLINVPIQFPRGGGFSLTMPIKPEDECLLIFSERSIDFWHEKGGTQLPGARRFHDLSDAIALVGLSSKPNKIPNYNPDSMELKADDGSVSVKWNADGTINVTANSEVIVTAPLSTVNGNAIVNGNTVMNGNLTVTGVINTPSVMFLP